MSDIKKDHSIGEGTGAVGGAIAGAAIGSAAGPVGTFVGAGVGGVVGAKAGDEAAEAVNPTDGRRSDAAQSVRDGRHAVERKLPGDADGDGR